MRNMVTTLALAALMAVPLYFAPSNVFAAEVDTAAKPAVKIGGFTQATVIKAEGNKALDFGFDRVRLVGKGTLNRLADYKLQVDFMKAATDPDKDGDTPGIIKDAEIVFKLCKSSKISVGKFKTPIGMEFNSSGQSLDVVKRGLGQALVFERNAGILLQSKGISDLGLGFAAGVFNAGPNKANDVGDPAEGQDYTVAGRVSVDPTKALHAEIFGGAALTSVAGQKSVVVLGGAAKLKLIDKLQLKGEFILRSDDQNDAADGTDLYVQAGFQVCPRLEPIVKYERLNVTKDAKDQGNLTLGLNIFLNPDKHKESKIQVNYVLSDLDGQDAIQCLSQGSF